MRRTVFVLLAVAIAACGGGGSSGDAGGDSYPGDAAPPPGCPVGFDEDTGTRFYVDPVAGADDNDGSSEHPWRSIQYVVDERVDCVDRNGVRRHADAPVRGGDTIVLRGAEGHDQTLEITGCYNDDYVKIKAEVLHQPRLATIHFRGSAYWRIEGLTLFNDSGGTLLRAEDHDVRGEVHHLQVMNNHFTSGELRTADDFQNRAATGVWLLGADHVTVQCNSFYKVGPSVFG